MPVPSRTSSSCTVTVPSVLTIAAETDVFVASTSTAAAITTGRPSIRSGVIGVANVDCHSWSWMTRSATPVSRRLPKARAQPASLPANCSRKSRNWRMSQSSPAAGCHFRIVWKSSGSASSGMPKSNQHVRVGTLPARKESSRPLRNVESAVPSVEVIQIWGWTPVKCSLVFMVGAMPSRISLPVSSSKLNASSMVNLSICVPWPATLVTASGQMKLPLRKRCSIPPLESLGLRANGASLDFESCCTKSLKCFSASLPVCAR